MLLIAASFLLGVLLSALHALPARTPVLIDRIVINVALPALVLHRVSSMQLGAVALLPALLAWLTLGLLVVGVLLASRMLHWPRATTGALLLVIPLGNTAFLGPPAVEALLGSDHLASALVYDQLGTFLGLVTYGSWVAAKWGSAAEAPRPGVLLRRVLRFPPFLALLAALALNPVGLPSPVVSVLAPVGSLVGPLALVGIGLRTTLPRRSTAVRPVLVGLGMRLILAPAALLAMALLAGGDGPAWSASVLQAGMPPMVTAGIVAVAAGLDERVVTMAVSGGLVLSLVTLPLLVAVLGL